MPDPYAILGLSRNANAEEIKKAYRKLARQYHPDTSAEPEAERRFKEVNAAYEVLSDAERRQRFDTFGDDGSRAAAGGPATDFGIGDLGDLMESFFGVGFGRGRSRGPRPVAQRGDNVEATVRLTLRDAVFGVQKEVETYAGGVCEPCGGAGLEPGSKRVRCDACGGAGEVRHVQRSVFGQMMTARPCGRCGGSGQVAEHPCRSCGGEGRLMRQARVTVDIPPGVEHGTTLRVRGRGEAGSRGGEPGDLYVHIGVEPDSVFRRDGDDLVCQLRIPITQAILGGTVVLPTLDGEETLTLEAGTQPGSLLRVRGKGVPHLGGRGRGDLVIAVDIDIPRKLSAEQHDLIQRFGELRGETGSADASPKPRKRGFKDVLRGS